MIRPAVVLATAGLALAAACTPSGPGDPAPAAADTETGASDASHDARELMRAGRYPEAAAAFSALASDHRAEPRYEYHAGLALVAAGRCNEAHTRFELAWQRAPGNMRFAEALIRTGASCVSVDAERRAGQLAMAAELFQTQPEADFAEALAMALAAAGHFEDAARMQARVVAARPDDAFAHGLLAGFERREPATRPWAEAAIPALFAAD